MSNLDPLHPLQSSILELLAQEPGLRVSELHQRLQERRERGVSLQNVYRTAAQLVDHQVLARTNNRLFLNLVWVSQLAHFAENAKANYLESDHVRIVLPQKDGDQREYTAQTLRGLDPTWNDLLLQIAALSNERTWYAFNSHPWYALGMPDTEQRLYQSLAAQKIKTHLLFGNNSFLDRYGGSLTVAEDFITALADQTPFPAEGYALWLAGDFVLEVIFPDVVANHFALFFKTVNSPEEFDPQLFSDVFKMKAYCRLTVTLDRARVQTLRKKLAAYFRPL